MVLLEQLVDRVDGDVASGRRLPQHFVVVVIVSSNEPLTTVTRRAIVPTSEAQHGEENAERNEHQQRGRRDQTRFTSSFRVLLR